MKAALVAALFGALLAVTYACGEVPYHSCVKEEKPTKCKAVKVCEDPVKEPCGDKYCEYPYACASLKKEECVGFLALKQKCGEPKKVCKEIKTPCGYGACGAGKECVKETVCYLKKDGYGRKMLDYGTASGTAATQAVVSPYGSAAAGQSTGKATGKNAQAAAASAAYAAPGSAAASAKGAGAADGASAVATADAAAKASSHAAPTYGHGKYYPTGHGHGCGKAHGDCKGYELVCEDVYKCVEKEPCVDVVVKKCVKSAYKPGIDLCYGGHHFYWAKLAHGEKCGEEYCGYGYECAEVVIQKCKTECGYDYCGYGYECVTEYPDYECDKYAYLEAICKDVYEPVCVPLSPYVLLKYEPPCKTVYKCEKEHSVCGSEYCPYGYACAVEYKKTCGRKYPYDKPMVVDPVACPKPKYVYPVHSPGYPSTAAAGSYAHAGPEAAGVKMVSTATGNGGAVAKGAAASSGK